MPKDDQGVAVSENGVEWLEGSTPDLSEREQMLVLHAYEDGYADGERHGYKQGGYEALRAATTLTTLMSNPLWQRNLDVLGYFQSMGAGDLTGVDGNDHGVAHTANVGPDLTVGVGAQVDTYG